MNCFRPFTLIFGLLCLSNSLCAQTFGTTFIAPAGSEAPIDSLSLSSGLFGPNPWTSHRLSGVTIRGLPMRQLDDYLTILPGITRVNGNLHFRGNRPYEASYFIEGFNLTNPLYNSAGVTLLPEAIEEIEVHTGAFGAGRAGGNGGVVVSRMRSGGETFALSLDYQTDDFVKPGGEYFGGTPLGLKNLVGTFSGPLPFGLRLFVAGQYNYLRNRQAIWLEPFRYDNLVTDQVGARPSGQPLPGPVEIKRNYVEGNWSENLTVQSSVTWSKGPFSVRALGSYEDNELPTENGWADAMENYFNRWRSMIGKTTTKFLAGEFKHTISPDLNYRIGVSWYDRLYRETDPHFGHNWKLYPDTVAHYNLWQAVSDPWIRGTYAGNSWSRYYYRPYEYSTIYGFDFAHPWNPNNSYAKNSQSRIMFSADAEVQILKEWRVTVGGTYDQWTMREFSVGNISNVLSYLDPNGDGIFERTFSSDGERRAAVIYQGNISNYGYNEWGAEADDGIDSPRDPLFVSVYVNNSIHHEGLSVEGGLRYEIFDVRTPSFPDYTAPAEFFTSYPSLYYASVNEAKLEPQQATHLVLPRLAVSYRSETGHSVYASYGRYAQFPSIWYFYAGNQYLYNRLDPSTRVPYNLGRSVLPGFLVQPERTTQYEIGGRYQALRDVSISATYFGKDLVNQLEQGKINDPAGDSMYVAYGNAGRGDVSGFEALAEYKGSGPVSVMLSYAYVSAKGGISDPEDWTYVSEVAPPSPLPPAYLVPFDYSVNHTVSALVEYRTEPEPNDLLSGFQGSVLLTYTSGHRYTKVAPTQNLGSAMPWNPGVRYLVDLRGVRPEEPANISSTPSVMNIDLRLAKSFIAGPTRIALYVNVLNLLNAKHVENVYPATRVTNDDGWIWSQFADPYRSIPLYTEFYTDINLKNRWAYTRATGSDLFGIPRQIRFGLTVTL